MLSSFTLISVIGVMLGVLVLVVVMTVIAGIEKQMKERILGFTPHILIQDIIPPMPEDEVGWESLAEEAIQLPSVEAAMPHIADHVMIDVASWQRPAKFHSIDSSDRSQIEGLRQMLDLEDHPESSADLGIDDRAVISSILADQYGIGVGATVRLLTARNIEEVMRAYNVTENPPLREAWKEPWDHASGFFAAEWPKVGDLLSLPIEAAFKAQDQIELIKSQNIREPERKLLEAITDSLGANLVRRDDEAGIFLLKPPARDEILKLIEAVNTTDPEKMDVDILKGMKSFVLPKEVEVVGVYQASQMAMTPDIFVPLHIGQDLAGLEDQVQGISLRLEDPYIADKIAAELRTSHGDRWAIRTWGQDYQAFFLLMAQQRVMMYFALSFIVLVSAFSMMAVMFTVTVQKKREIGVMKALGAAPAQIVRVFLYQGMLLGAVGALIGIGLGHVVIFFRGSIQAVMRATNFDPFSENLIGSNIIPAHHNPVEQVFIGIAAFILCSLAAFVPAYFAARSDAAKSLRNL